MNIFRLLTASCCFLVFNCFSATSDDQKFDETTSTPCLTVAIYKPLSAAVISSKSAVDKTDLEERSPFSSSFVKSVLKVPFVLLENAISEKHPHLFTGHSHINPSIVEDLRKIPPAIMIGGPKQDFRKGGWFNDILQKYTQRGNFADDLTSYETFFMLLSKAYESHDKNNEAEQLLEEFSIYKYISSFLDYSGKSEGAYPRILPIDRPEHTQQGALKTNLEKEIENLGDQKVFYPLVQGELGVSFLASQYIQGVFPIGISFDSVKVHGVAMDPFQFAMHDIIHADTAKGESFTCWVDSFLEASGVSSRVLLEQAEDLFVERQKIVDGVYYHIYQWTTQQLLLKNNDMDSYMKSIVGLFLLTHEFPYNVSFKYDERSPKRFIQKHINFIRYAVKGSLTQDDVLKTSHLDGATSASDEEIIKALKPQIIGTIFDPLDEQKIIESISHISVRRSKHSVKAEVSYKNGGNEIFDDTTNYSKFTSFAQDMQKILELSEPDRNFSYPDFKHENSFQENFQLAEIYYRNIKKSLKKTLSFFEQIAFAAIEGDFLKRYESDFDLNQAALRKIVKDLTIHQKESQSLLQKLLS